MTDWLKIVGYTAIGFCIAYFFNSEDTFLPAFTENIISLLTTILAINIATKAIIVKTIVQLSEKHQFPFTKTKKELKSNFQIQIILIGIVFFTTLISKADFICVNIPEINTYWQYSIAIGAFLYFIETIYDLGSTLITLIDS